ncbi:MAG: FkbM family methyltransferase [Pyrinomonadaceae bacterium]|nr:FkbM family methyltransferase [Pyrinomonadaceae bacterium]
MNINSRQFALMASINTNGFWETAKYIFGYVLHKAKLKSFLKYKGTRINLRYNSSDFTVFREIFLVSEYDLIYPKGVEVVVDAGANIGASTIWFAKKFPHAKIIAIEPDKNNFSVLRSNVKDLDNVIPLNKGLWSTNQKLNVNSRKNFGEWAKFTSPDAGGDENSIDGISIDQLIEDFAIEKIDVFKIDIEGAEKEIFKESKWVEKVNLLIIETHDWLEKGCSKAVFDALRERKFSTSFAGEKFVIQIEE